MKGKMSLAVCLVVILGVPFLGQSTGADSLTRVVWESIQLGSFGGGHLDGHASCINDIGQVAGESTTATGETHAFLWTDTMGMIDLGTLGGNSSCASDINNRGQVVGWSTTAKGARHAFLWTDATGMIDLGTFGGLWSEAHGINDLGQVVGIATSATQQERAFLWTNTTGMIDLGDLAGWGSEAYDINDLGQVVGSSANATGYCYAVLWTAPESMIDLGVPDGGSISIALSINNHGQVVGYYIIAPGTEQSRTRAFLWTNATGMIDLGTLPPPCGDHSIAQDINDAGRVVGRSYNSTGTTHAFLWTATGGMVDLNVTGNIIDNQGQVVGYGTCGGAYCINNLGQVVGEIAYCGPSLTTLKTQYYLTVVSEHGTPTGEGWYNAGSSAQISVEGSVQSFPLMRYVFERWEGSGVSDAASPSATVQMSEPRTVTAVWKGDYTMLAGGGLGVVAIIALILYTRNKGVSKPTSEPSEEKRREPPDVPEPEPVPEPVPIEGQNKGSFAVSGKSSTRVRRGVDYVREHVRGHIELKAARAFYSKGGDQTIKSVARTSDGEPVPGAEIYVELGNDEDYTWHGRTDEDGTFVVHAQGLKPGDHSVVARVGNPVTGGEIYIEIEEEEP